MTGADIIALVAEAWEVPPRTLTGIVRSQRFSRPRHVAMALIRDHLGYSYPQIGRLFGDRDHTTVLMAVRGIEARIAKDEDLAAKVQRLRDALSMVDVAQAHDKRDARAMADSVARAIRAALVRSATSDPESFMTRAAGLLASIPDRETR